MERVFNFAPGPSMLPLPVLEQIQKELLCYGSTGMSVMEMSHRSSMYLDIFNQTVADLREVMAIPDHYKVIFPQGGATAMFAAVAMNLMDGGHADYVDSGNFAHNALVEAQKYGAVNVAGFLPRGKLHPHSGLYALPGCEIRPHHDQQHDLRHALGSHSRHGRRAAGRGYVLQHPQRGLRRAQIRRDLRRARRRTSRPAGVVILIVREDLLGRALPITPKVMDLAQARRGTDSMLNTPNCLRHLRRGAVPSSGSRRRAASRRWKRATSKRPSCCTIIWTRASSSPARRRSADRSRMNVTFVTGDAELDAKFVKEAAAQGPGATSRATASWAACAPASTTPCPSRACKKLVDFMKQFETEN